VEAVAPITRQRVRLPSVYLLMDTAAVFYGKENANSITWQVPQKHERATHRVIFFV
jgi:hypothetical protein